MDRLKQPTKHSGVAQLLQSTQASRTNSTNSCCRRPWLASTRTEWIRLGVHAGSSRLSTTQRRTDGRSSPGVGSRCRRVSGRCWWRSGGSCRGNRRQRYDWTLRGLEHQQQCTEITKLTREPRDWVSQQMSVRVCVCTRTQCAECTCVGLEVGLEDLISRVDSSMSLTK